MDKLLYITNIGGKKFSTNFVGTALVAAKELGIDFYVVANRNASNKEQIAEDEKAYGVHLLHADIDRSPFSPSNWRAYRQICNIIEENGIEYIHCNTPVGGLLGRLAGKKCSVKKVIYQAHGFHFYKGAPLINWILYYPIEKFLAHYTDSLITITNEDYLRAQKFKLRSAGSVYYVPGVGIETEKFGRNNDISSIRREKRDELGIKDDNFVIISAGELNKNKNNKVIIQAISELADKSIHYVLCGNGPCEEELKNQVKSRHLTNQVHFLGYRTDIKDLLAMSDIFVLPSFREGMSRSLMEAMASGLPCVVSKIRGNTDIVVDNINGYTCDPQNYMEFASAIRKLKADDGLLGIICKQNIADAKKYDISMISKEIKRIYTDIFK